MYAQRDCLSREGRQWSDIIDYSYCYTMITMLYQVFEVVSMIIINSPLRFVKLLMYLQENLTEENIVVMLEEFAALVEMTVDTIDQSRINFEVITNVLNATSSIVNNATLNDADLKQVYTYV